VAEERSAAMQKRTFLHRNTPQRWLWSSNVRKPVAKQEAMATGFCNRWTYGTGLCTGLQGRGAGYPHAGDGLTHRRGSNGCAPSAPLADAGSAPRCIGCSISSVRGTWWSRGSCCQCGLLTRHGHQVVGQSRCMWTVSVQPRTPHRQHTSISYPPAATSPPTPW
jgi:hypothetical protein